MNATLLNAILLKIKCVHYCIKIEFQITVNFLDITSDDKDFPKFVTKKWIEVCDQSGGNYSPNKEIRIKTSMLRSDLCNYSDAYIVVNGNIIVNKKALTADDIEEPNNTAANVSATNTANDNSFGEKKLGFKNNAPFIKCVSKINRVKIDNAEDLDVVMSMYKYVNTVKIIEKQQKVCGIIIEMNQIVVQMLTLQPTQF